MRTVDATKMAVDMGIKTRFLLDYEFTTLVEGTLEETKDFVLGAVFELLTKTRNMLEDQGGMDKTKGMEFALELDVNQDAPLVVQVVVTFEDNCDEPHLLAKISKVGV